MDLIREFRPTKIFVSHPADENVDHQALYLFTRLALWQLGEEASPELWPFLVHYTKWPDAKRAARGRGMNPPVRLRNTLGWHEHAVDGDAREAKRGALKAHRSQFNYSADYLAKFVRPNELFGDFPEVDLAGGEGDRFAYVQDGHLVLSVPYSRLQVMKKVKMSCEVMGYRADTPFRDMPKLQVFRSEGGYQVFDRGQPLADRTVKARAGMKTVRFSIPLTALGEPERVFANVWLTVGTRHPEWQGWRVLHLPASKP
jgi:hypothetical protein